MFPWGTNRLAHVDANTYANDTFILVSLYLQIAGAAIFLCSFIIWGYYEFTLKLVLPRVRRLLRWRVTRALLRVLSPTTLGGGGGGNDDGRQGKELEARQRHAEDQDYFPIMYTFVAMASLAAILFVNAFAGNFATMDPSTILALNVPVLVFVGIMQVFAQQVRSI